MNSIKPSEICIHRLVNFSSLLSSVKKSQTKYWCSWGQTCNKSKYVSNNWTVTKFLHPSLELIGWFQYDFVPNWFSLVLFPRIWSWCLFEIFPRWTHADENPGYTYKNDEKITEIWKWWKRSQWGVHEAFL